MKGNKLWGTLPSTLATLRGVEELDFSHNNLSERGVFKNASAFSVEGNKKLCGGISVCSCHRATPKGPEIKDLLFPGN